MKHLFCLIALTLFLTGVYGQDGKREKINTAAVLDFRVISGIDKDEALALTSRFRNSLSESKRFIVLERGEMDQILKAQDFSLTDVCNSAECAVQVGKLLAAEKIVSGDIGKVGNTYSISVRLIDVTTGQIEKTVSEEYRGKSDGLLNVFDIAAQKIAGTFAERAPKRWWWIGSAVIAGGIGAVILLKKGTSGNSSIGTPPGPPPTIP